MRVIVAISSRSATAGSSVLKRHEVPATDASSAAAAARSDLDEAEPLGWWRLRERIGGRHTRLGANIRLSYTAAPNVLAEGMRRLAAAWRTFDRRPVEACII